MTSSTMLVVGAAGKFAGLVVPELARRGARVRGFVRDETAASRARNAGAQEIAFGDLHDHEALRQAMQGVDGVFHLGPAFLPDEAQLGLNVIAAARAERVRKFVFSSVIQPTNIDLANHASKIPVETALFGSGLEYTILHPANLMQNIVAAWPSILQSGVFAEPFPTTTSIARVDYRDVAEIAAIALMTDRLAFGTFELASEMINREQIASIMSEVSNRRITAAAPSFAQWSIQAQLPYSADQQRLLAKVFEYYTAHGCGGNELTLRAILGRKPRSMRDFVADLHAGHQHLDAIAHDPFSRTRAS